MKEIRIFVASSRELLQERNYLSYLLLLNEEAFERSGFRVKLSKWEYVDPMMTEERTEDRYLAEMMNSDAAIVLYKNVLGKYTQEEYEKAVLSITHGRERLKSHRVVFMENGGCVTHELEEFKNRLPKDAFRCCSDLNELEIEFLAFINEISAFPLQNAANDSSLRVVNAFVAVDDELMSERDALADLVLRLNEELERRGVRLRFRFYTRERHHELLEFSELALVVYCTRFGQFGRKEFDDTSRRVKESRYPKRFYVFFRDGHGKPMEAPFASFKKGFEETQGHFVCRFENVNTLKLDFVFALENLLGMDEGVNTLAQLRENSINVGNFQVGDFDALPIVANNAGLKALKMRLMQLQAECERCQCRCREAPQDEDAYSELLKISTAMTAVQKSIDKEQMFIMGLVKKMASLSIGLAKDVAVKAYAEIEKGNIKTAATMLEEISDSQKKARRWMIQRVAERVEEEERDVMEFAAGFEVDSFRADVILAWTEVPFEERFRRVDEIYEAFIEDVAYYGQRCSFASKNEIDALHAKALHVLARLYWYNGRESSIEPKLTTALEIRRRLAKADARYRGDLADSVHNLALLHDSTNKLAAAEIEFRDALNIYRQLAADNARKYEHYVAMALNNLAALHCDIGRFSEAEIENQEALTIRQGMDYVDHVKNCNMIASILHDLAVMYAKTNRMMEAGEMFEEELAICRHIVKEGTTDYEKRMATSMLDYAIFLYMGDRFAEAEVKCNEALACFRHSANGIPARYFDNVARAYHTMAMIHRKMNLRNEAEQEFQESLRLRSLLVRENPDLYLPSVAESLTNLSAVLMELSQYEKAEQGYLKALDIRRNLARVNPEKYNSSVAVTLNNLANLHYDTGRHGEAEAEYTEALELSRHIMEQTHADNVALRQVMCGCQKWLRQIAAERDL